MQVAPAAGHVNQQDTKTLMFFQVRRLRKCQKRWGMHVQTTSQLQSRSGKTAGPAATTQVIITFSSEQISVAATHFRTLPRHCSTHWRTCRALPTGACQFTY